MSRQEDTVAPGDGAEEVEEIRRDIVRTQDTLGDTIQAIQEKLSPSTLIEEARGPVEETTDHIVTEVQRAVRESVDYLVAEAQGPMKDLGDQLITRVTTAARETTDHILERARTTATEAAANIVETTGHAVREATIGKVEKMATKITQTTIEVADGANQKTKGVGAAVKETITGNPLPTALAALGLGWLYLKRAKPSGATVASSAPAARPPAAPAVRAGNPMSQALGGAAGTIGDTVSDTAGTVGGAVGNAATGIGSTMNTAAGAVSDTMSGAATTVGGAVSDAAGAVEETVGQVATRAQGATRTLMTEAHYQVLRLNEGLQSLVQENPLALGAAAVALGSLIGLAVPETPLENQLMGSARDAVLDQAGTTAQDALAKVGQVASEAHATAMQAAGA